MGDVWFYRLLFVLSVIAGIALPETIPLSLRLALVRGGIGGLVFGERISEQRSEFGQQRLSLGPERLTSPKKTENPDAFCRDLSLPPGPDEGY